ncbi:MAG TPA: glycoside hydrolase family 57 protein [Candidatus Kapabacteria bacterium]|nr:glycoside hydrolase family 57 protein [Candidatus Kapabacteria bacterium]
MPKDPSTKPIRLALLWHQHQPYYRAGNKFILPWVWLHATKDYLEMAQHFERVPAMKATINLVPSLIKQIEEYLSGEVEDPLLTVLREDCETLTASDKRYILDNCFHANYDRMIARSARYGELHGAVHADRQSAEKRFTAQDYRDLLMHYTLAWTGEFIRQEEAVAALISKDRDYSEEDKSRLLDILRERVASIIDLHKRLADAGQIELSTTPFYHPILPLVCDTNTGGQSVPGLTLPTKRYREREDAELQLTRGREFFAKRFGREANGIWPSEGSLSEEVLQIMIEQGVRWTATDEAVLTRSLAESQGLDTKLPEGTPSFAKYLPFKYSHDGKEITVFFRDHALSDNIGFVYQSWKPEDAVADLVKHLTQIRSDLVTHYGEDVLDRACVSVILDGENCWEYYDRNGFDFLNQLYSTLSTHPEIRPCTMTEVIEALDEKHVPLLQKLTPGSWINANFNIWIGHAEDNLAWDELYKARCAVHDFEEWVETQEGDVREQALIKLEKAREELLIAEGSDWCWWYGDDHFSVQKDKFDELYRMHLRAIYVFLEKRVPGSLAESIMVRAERESHRPKAPEVLHHPVITGDRGNATWSEVDEHELRIKHGAMHKAEKLALDELRAEIIEDKLYLRIVPRGGSPADLLIRLELKDSTVAFESWPGGIELKATDKAISLGSIEFAWTTAMELALGVRPLSDGKQPFALTLSSESLAHSLRIPQTGWLLH